MITDLDQYSDEISKIIKCFTINNICIVSIIENLSTATTRIAVSIDSQSMNSYHSLQLHKCSMCLTGERISFINKDNSQRFFSFSGDTGEGKIVFDKLIPYIEGVIKD